MYQTCVLNSWRVGLCIRSVRHMFKWHWQLLNTSLLLNNHAQFQNIRGEEMSHFKQVMTHYVQVLLNLCLTVYVQKAVKMLLKGRTSGNGQMDKIFMILKTKLTSGIILILSLGYAHVYEQYTDTNTNLYFSQSTYMAT